jgi:hypothetical protein
MKKALIILSLGCLGTVVFTACKKDNNNKTSTTNSAMAGFWTYKTDPSNPQNWNDNVLFKDDGTFRMYTALTLADTAAGPAIADSGKQVKTFGTYTVSGSEVKMVFSEFASLGMTCEGSVNSAHNSFTGKLELQNDPTAASPLWVLTKP